MRISKGYTLRTLGDEYIILPDGLDAVDFSHLISMNASAAFLWKAVEEKEFDVETLVGLLMDEYDVSHEKAEKDVAALLKVWKETGAISNY